MGEVWTLAEAGSLSSPQPGAAEPHLPPVTAPSGEGWLCGKASDLGVLAPSTLQAAPRGREPPLLAPGDTEAS